MTTRSKVSLVSSCVLVLAGSALVLAARSERYAPAWADAKSAYSWDNQLCTRLAAFDGLVKARSVLARTEEIQKASRYVGEIDGLFLYETPLGNFWMPQPNDLWSLAVILAEQEHEMYGGDGLGVRPGDVVIDAGAHVGLFARTALAMGASKVITFEVAPNAVRAQRKNLEKEIADGRVIVLAKGVWFEEATLPMVQVDGCSACNSVSHPNMQAMVDVPLTTIDNAMEELKIDRVDFIKLDVENAEANALRGAQYTIKKHHPRVAVALENHKMRIAYGYEVMGLMNDLFPGYRYVCGACTNPEKTARVLPEILHFYPGPS